MLEPGEDEGEGEVPGGGVSVASFDPDDDVSVELDGTGVGDDDAGKADGDDEEPAELLRSIGFLIATPPSWMASALRAKFFSLARRFWNHT